MSFVILLLILEANHFLWLHFSLPFLREPSSMFSLFSTIGKLTRKKGIKYLVHKMVKLVKIPLEFFVILQFVDAFTHQNTIRDIEICGTSNGHRKYLELGDSGRINAENILVPKVILFFYALIYIIDTCFRHILKLSIFT